MNNNTISNDGNDNNDNGDDTITNSNNAIISRYGKEGYKHIMHTLADICNAGKFRTYYFLDEHKIYAYISDAVPRDDYVLSNIDLILYKFDHNRKNELGTFKLLEFKDLRYNRLRKAQELTFGLIDRMLRSSSESYRYEGFYLARIDIDNRIFIVNDRILSEDEFKSFLQGELQIEPYKFRMERYL